MLVNTILYNSTSLIALVVALVDVGLTSSIAVSFGFDGLFDLGWITESTLTYSIMGLTYTALFVGWYFDLIYGSMNWFMVLYFYVIVVACGIYVITELYLIYKNGDNGISYLLIGGSAGFVGIMAVFYTPLATYLCSYLGKFWSPIFNGQFYWFLLSDVAVYSLYHYVLIRKDIPPSKFL